MNFSVFRPVLLLVLAILPASLCAQSSTRDAGKTVFELKLSDPKIREAIERQGGEIVNEGPDGKPAARFHISPEEFGVKKAVAGFVLPLKAVQGTRVTLTGKIRGENVQGRDPKQPLPGYLGGKAQIYVNTPTRGKRWQDTRALHGTFDWRDIGLLCGIVPDASEAHIRIGLEGASGTVWVSELKVVVVQTKPVRPSNSAARTQPGGTQMRGFMSPHTYREKDFDDLAAMNVNLVRWQMYKHNHDQRPYKEWIDEELDDLARALDGAAARGIKLIVDMHSTPGGRLPDRTHRMYLEKTYSDQFVWLWQAIARRFKGHPGLWAYDLVNEPVQNFPSPPGQPDWRGVQIAAGKAIRAIDPKTFIIISVDEWDIPDPFHWLEPVDIPNVIYQAHMYWPGEFTHQGVYTNQGIADGQSFERNKVTYPGTIHGQPLNKEALRRYLQPVRDFQLAYNTRIFIGEFSAARWAPGADLYLDDLISIFEEYGWDWTYHAFRESPIWSVEHADLPYDRTNHPLATTPTNRMKTLQKWFAKNKRAASVKR